MPCQIKRVGSESDTIRNLNRRAACLRTPSGIKSIDCEGIEIQDHRRKFTELQSYRRADETG